MIAVYDQWEDLWHVVDVENRLYLGSFFTEQEALDHIADLQEHQNDEVSHD